MHDDASAVASPGAMAPTDAHAQRRRLHRRAIALMVLVTFLWSTAGVVTRHLHYAAGLEVTFWRSFFAAVFVAGYLIFVRRNFVGALRASGRAGLVSGLMWGLMFSCFMLAILRTTVANTLITLSVAPLLTAILTWVVLRQPVGVRTWFAIAVAAGGMVMMFAGAFQADHGRHVVGMLIALGVPAAAAVNVVTIKKSGHAVDLVPAVFLGGLFSAVFMLVLMLADAGSTRFGASAHDIGLLALLGFFQLGIPCTLMLRASRHLSAPELSLLSLLEVLQGPLWAWLFAGETPTAATLAGGAVVLGALVFNEVAGAARQPTASA